MTSRIRAFSKYESTCDAEKSAAEDHTEVEVSRVFTDLHVETKKAMYASFTLINEKFQKFVSIFCMVPEVFNLYIEFVDQYTVIQSYDIEQKLLEYEYSQWINIDKTIRKMKHFYSDCQSKKQRLECDRDEIEQMFNFCGKHIKQIDQLQDKWRTTLRELENNDTRHRMFVHKVHLEYYQPNITALLKNIYESFQQLLPIIESCRNGLSKQEKAKDKDIETFYNKFSRGYDVCSILIKHQPVRSALFQQKFYLTVVGVRDNAERFFTCYKLLPTKQETFLQKSAKLLAPFTKAIQRYEILIEHVKKHKLHEEFFEHLDWAEECRRFDL